MEPEARPLALGPDGRIGQPDRGHQVPPAELGEDPGVDPVGLGGERGEPLDLHRVGDLDIPAEKLEGVVHEASPVHRLDRRGHLLAVPADDPNQRPQGITVGSDSRDLDRPTVLVEHVHIEPLARQVQSGVQHLRALLVWFLREPNVTTGALLHDIQSTRRARQVSGGPRSGRVSHRRCLTSVATPSASPVDAAPRSMDQTPNRARRGSMSRVNLLDDGTRPSRIPGWAGGSAQRIPVSYSRSMRATSLGEVSVTRTGAGAAASPATGNAEMSTVPVSPRANR